MMFRNENNKVAGTSQSITASPSPSPPSQWNIASAAIIARAQTPPLPVLRPSAILVPSIEEQAITYVFQNYVQEYNESENLCGLFDFLPAIYRRLPADNILIDAIVALGLAGLANVQNLTAFMVTANLRYCKAVRRISGLLERIEEAKSDEVLVAVCLLALFEVSIDLPDRTLTRSQLTGLDQCFRDADVHENLDAASERSDIPNQFTW